MSAREEEFTAYRLSHEDEPYINHTYKDEQELLEYVKRGDVEEVTRLCTSSFPAYPDLLGPENKKNEEYMAVITIALVSRAVVQAGISSEESFQYADVFIKAVATSTRIQDIIAIRNSAIVAFTEMVRKQGRHAQSNQYVEECRKYITAHVFKKLSAKDVAAELHLNPIYLERIFKADEGMTIGQYIQKEKINWAENLLKYSDRSILEISDYLSFSSQSYFGKVFQKETGMTPMAYRKSSRQADA